MNRDFAHQLVAARVRMGLTQGELATQIGVSQAAVSRWEKGKHRPNPSVLMRLRRLGQALPQPAWRDDAARDAATRPSAARARLRLRPLDAPRRRLSDHLRAAIDCALRAGKEEFAVVMLQPLLEECLNADRRDPRRRRSDDRASATARSS